MSETRLSYSFNEHKFRWFGIPLLALFIVLVVDRNHQCFAPGFWVDLLITSVFTFSIWNSNHLIISHYRRKLPSLSDTPRRILTTFFLTEINTVLICITLDYLLFIIFSKPAPYVVSSRGIIIGVMASSFVFSVYEGLYFFEKWKEAMLSAEELKKANLQSQFDTLKNQVNPHFLFNSLNTLSSLVEEDSKKAISFIQKMADVYRYILQNNDKPLIPLRQEMEFINSYVFMLKTRFDENLQVEISISQKHLDYLIPPHTLQILVENAVKHNEVSEENPLSVRIYSDDSGYLIVSNNLQIKNSLVKSNGVGLKNVLQRYALLSEKPVIISEENKEFTVTMPLIKDI